MSVIDTVAISVIVVISLFIMYKALKEPLDLLFGLLGRGLGSIKDKIADGGDVGTRYEEIRYG